MLKFVYIIFLGITSIILFIFSKEKKDIPCSQEITGTITSVSESGLQHLVIITDQHKIYSPQSMNSNVVLAAGKKVTICYSTDSSAVSTDNNRVPVNIHSVVYLK